MIIQLSNKVFIFLFIMIISIGFTSCNKINSDYLFFEIKLPNNEKVIRLNVNEKKDLDISLFNENNTDSFMLYSMDPRIVEVESVYGRILKAKNVGKTFIIAETYYNYERFEIKVEVEVYDTNIPTK